MNCGLELVRFLISLFNFLGMLCGATLGAMGTYMVIQIHGVSNFKEMFALNSVSIVTLILGIVVFIISLIGCCGALREKSCQLTLFSVIMFILFLCQISFGIYVWAKYSDILKLVTGFIKELWDQQATTGKVLHEMERDLKCCGYRSYSDYGSHLPGSCCGLEDSKACPKSLFQIGCSEAVSKLWNSNSKIIKYGSLAVSGVLLTGSVLASYLAHKLRSTFRYSD